MKRDWVVILAIFTLLLSFVPRVGAAGTDDPTHADHPRGRYDQQIRAIMDPMTLEEKVGQLFIVHVYGKTAEDPNYENMNFQNQRGGKNFKEVIEKYHVGGVIYFNWSYNITDPADPVQTNKLSNDLQKIAMDSMGIPLFIATDQEGGIVQRLRKPGTNLPGNMALGATGSEELAYKAAQVMGSELKALGMNMDFAPVVDVNSNYKNPVIGVRSFGEQPDLVSKLGVAQVKGYQSVGIMATVKHFPGHGDTDTDSHYGLPIIQHTKEQLYNVDLKPFKQAIDQGIGAIMTAHIVVPALDDSGLPATLSKPILTDLLRKEFGFDGLIITDSLGMSGANVLPPEQVPVAAFLAGNDILLNPPDVDLAYNAVLNAVKDGTISEERLDESVYRILRAKFEMGLFDNPYAPEVDAKTKLGTTENLAVADEIADKSITLLENKNHILPLQKEKKLFVVGFSSTANAFLLASKLQEKGYQIVNTADEADILILLTYTSNDSTYQSQTNQVKNYLGKGKPVVVIATRNPYDLMAIPEVDGYLASYGSLDVSINAVARVLAGEINPTGKLPVAIPGLYEIGYGRSYVDVSALESLVAQAKAITNEEGTYTESSFIVLLDAIAAAENVLKDYAYKTQEEIDEAAAKLEAAIQGLEKVQKIDASKLEELLAKAKAISSEGGVYTSESFKAFQDAILFAEKVLKTANTQEEIDEAIAKLEAAIQGLEKVQKIDTSKLEELLEKAKGFSNKDGIYTESSYKALQDAIQYAEKVLKNHKSQDEIDQAAELLQNALKTLEKASPKASEPVPSKGGKPLPDTSANDYNWLLAGSLFVMAGLVLVLSLRKKNAHPSVK